MTLVVMNIFGNLPRLVVSDCLCSVGGFCWGPGALVHLEMPPSSSSGGKHGQHYQRPQLALLSVEPPLG